MSANYPVIKIEIVISCLEIKSKTINCLSSRVHVDHTPAKKVISGRWLEKKNRKMYNKTKIAGLKAFTTFFQQENGLNPGVTSLD